MDRRFVLIVASLFIIVFGLTFWWLGRSPSDPSGMASPAIASGEEVDADVYFRDCNEVKAAGRQPLLAGQPGYRKELDPDGTGVACPP